MIYLVRQGQTDWNKLKRFNGITETDLNQVGIRQARQQAAVLKDIHIDLCFCSPQNRARQTANIIFDGVIVFDDRLTEIDCGEFEGVEETAESMKLFWKSAKEGANGVENIADFMRRNNVFCNTLQEQYQGKNVIIVTHAANARVIDYVFSGKPEGYDFTRGVAKAGEILEYQN